MRKLGAVMAVAIVGIWLTSPARADESNKLTYLTFSQPIHLPGVTLPAGRYRFELADPVESRRVIEVQNDDGTRQLAMLLTVPDTLSEPAKDAVVLFGEEPAGEPEAVQAWVYPGERVGYEFIYPHDEALQIASEHHTSVLSRSGETIERIDENGQRVPGVAK